MQTQHQSLSAEQQIVLDHVLVGRSVYIGGPAGTGKTFLLNAIIRQLQGNGKDVAVTASTGIAAVNVKGTTIHSFASIVEEADGTIRSNTAWGNKQRLREIDVLVIDEISMIHADLFDALEKILTEIRCYDQDAKELFGGLQLVLCGDFLQLPPVDTKQTKKKMCFQAKCWKQCVQCMFELTKVFRQEDAKFVAILNELRYGNCSQEVAQLFAGLNKPVPELNGIKPTQIYTKNVDVDALNNQELDKITELGVVYASEDHIYSGEHQAATLTKQTKERLFGLLDKGAPHSTMNLKKGAQVMLTKNLDVLRGLVNGSRGIIVDFQKKDSLQADSKWREKDIQSNPRFLIQNGNLLPVVMFTNQHQMLIEPALFQVQDLFHNRATRFQVPLKLAWYVKS